MVSIVDHRVAEIADNGVASVVGMAGVIGLHDVIGMAIVVRGMAGVLSSGAVDVPALCISL